MSAEGVEAGGPFRHHGQGRIQDFNLGNVKRVAGSHEVRGPKAESGVWFLGRGLSPPARRSGGAL